MNELNTTWRAKYAGLSLILLTFALTACGGGSQFAEVPPPTPPPSSPPPSPPTAPSTESPPAGDCDSNQVLIISEIASENITNSNELVSNAVDHDLSSYWRSSDSDASMILDLGKTHRIKELRIAWKNGKDKQFDFSLFGSESGDAYYDVALDQQTQESTELPQSVTFSPINVRYLKLTTNFINAQTASIYEVLVFGCAIDGTAPSANSDFTLSDLNLDPSKAPSENFDLLTWGLDVPLDTDNNGRSDRVIEQRLADGYSSEYFYTASDGGLVMSSPLYGPKTSTNTSYVRTELREMLRRGNTSISTQGHGLNNWILGYQPETTVPVGGRGGILTASLAINEVSKSGENYQLGRVIIGQIHASSDEPLRLYYRKRPEHRIGYIYLAHEINNGDDIIKMVYGPAYNNENNQPNFTTEPSHGIALNQVFTYQIVQAGARIDVFIRKDGPKSPIIAHQFVDMNARNSAYDVQDEWMYFKAGVYSGNNSGGPTEKNQATFYYLHNEH